MPKVFDFSPVKRPNFIFLVCKFFKKPLQELIQSVAGNFNGGPLKTRRGAGGSRLLFLIKKVCKNSLI